MAKTARRMKRIEVNRKVGPGRVRVSRTGGANVSVQPAKGVTLNTAHGLRVARSWSGVQLALQGKRVILRGRWTAGDGKTNLNLSKSGVSVSHKTAAGTLNITHPKRSSASIGGIQVRGKDAAIINAISIAFELAATLLITACKILGYLLNLAWALTALLLSSLRLALAWTANKWRNRHYGRITKP